MVVAACGDDDDAAGGAGSGGRPDASTTGGASGSGGTLGGGGSGATGGNGGAGGDSGEGGVRCGNGRVEPPEECDDPQDTNGDFCLADCTLACGDGVINAAEKCDVGIPAPDPGSCPTACSSSDPCARSTLAGAACSAECQTTAITTPIAGDGCCPPDATAQDDSDCSPACGNGVLEPGETCDTGIVTGFGACPTPATCDDQNACSVDAVKNGSCRVECDWSTQVAPRLDETDGCCPQGATSANDADCSADCGNGQLDAGESCDPGITSGEGVCLTTCPAAEPCTRQLLVQANPCDPRCVSLPITQPLDGDQCCPEGANSLLDADCLPRCGNGVVEAGEDCDAVGPDCEACRFVPSVFRVNRLVLSDPHMFLQGDPDCSDVTAVVNSLFAQNIENDAAGGVDGSPDGILDLSFVTLFRPLRQVTSPGQAELTQARCAAPFPPAGCAVEPGAGTQAFSYTNRSSGTCLEILPGTTGAYPDAPVPVDAGASGCFVGDEGTLSLDVAGLSIALTNARMAGQWNATPATAIAGGLLRGFLSEESARQILFPADLPAPLGGAPLTLLLPGSPENACPGIDDRDVGPEGARGWWFYFAYESQLVTWTP